MIRQCFLTKSGIQFQAEKLRDIGLDPGMLYPNVLERPPPMSIRKILKPACIKEAKLGLFNCEDCAMHRAVKDCGVSDTVDGRGANEKSEMGSMTKSPGVYESENENDVDADAEDAVKDIVEEHEELHDALSPIYDQLSARWIWWILEYLPTVHHIRKQDGRTVKLLS